MLVTVSGIVGSGKTTAVRVVADRMRANDAHPVEVWNFRSLECFAWLGRRAPRTGRRLHTPPVPQRGRHYVPRTLTALMALGYALRILSFRWYRFKHRGSHHICNRYFYDNFAHFALGTRRERLWMALLRMLIPQPDLAILVVASPTTIAGRRPNYAPEYLSEVSAGYARLVQLFPRMQTVSTDREAGLVAVSQLTDALHRR